MQNGLGLENADEHGTQIKEERSLLVGLLGDTDYGALLGALITEIPLVAALEQIADSRRDESAGKRLPHPMARRDLGSIRGKAEVGIRAEMCSDFLRLQFINVQSSRQQGRVVGLKHAFHSVPCPNLGRRRSSGLRCLTEERGGSEHQARNCSQ